MVSFREQWRQPNKIPFRDTKRSVIWLIILAEKRTRFSTRKIKSIFFLINRQFTRGRDTEMKRERKKILRNVNLELIFNRNEMLWQLKQKTKSISMSSVTFYDIILWCQVEYRKQFQPRNTKHSRDMTWKSSSILAWDANSFILVILVILVYCISPRLRLSLINVHRRWMQINNRINTA